MARRTQFTASSRSPRSLASVRRRKIAPGPRRFPRLTAALLDHLLTTSPFCFAFLDRQFRFVRLTESMAKMNGIAHEAHVGGTLCDVIGGEHWEVVKPYCDAALTGRAQRDVSLAGRIPGCDGACRHSLVSFYPIYDDDEIAGIGLTLKEASDRFELEQQVHQSGIERRHYIAEMMAALTDGKLRLCHDAAALPEPLESVGPPIPLAPHVLCLFRHQVMDAASWLGFDDDRTADFVLGVGEALDNVLVHAGEGSAQVFIDRERRILQVRVIDQGGGIDERHLHRAALERGYTTAGTLGHGFFLILNTCDRVWLLTAPTGTTIVLEQDRVAPLPEWLAGASNA